MQVGNDKKQVLSDGRIGLVLAGLALLLVISLSASVGMADFTTTSTTQSLVGTKIVSDNSFSFGQSGLILVQSADEGDASSTSAQEIGEVKPLLRTNSVTLGNFAYKLDVTEATELSSGTWTIKIYQDGSQVGNTMTVTQGSALAGMTEGATVIADLGTSVSSTTLFEVRITKTG